MAYEKYAGSFASRKKEKLEKGECFTKQEIQKLAISLFRSVSSLHKNGVYHGNLKPSNIFFPDESESLSSTIFVGEAGFVSTKGNSNLLDVCFLDLGKFANLFNFCFKAKELS